jgi:non-specific serine/threonine protein kinase
VEYAGHLQIQAKTIAQTREKVDDLTTREREVAGLIALGKTNREIAEELVLSKRTVEKHVEHILSKLGLTNRTQIVRWKMDKRQPQISE